MASTSHSAIAPARCSTLEPLLSLSRPYVHVRNLCINTGLFPEESEWLLLAYGNGRDWKRLVNLPAGDLAINGDLPAWGMSKLEGDWVASTGVRHSPREWSKLVYVRWRSLL